MHVEQHLVGLARVPPVVHVVGQHEAALRPASRPHAQVVQLLEQILLSVGRGPRFDLGQELEVHLHQVHAVDAVEVADGDGGEGDVGLGGQVGGGDDRVLHELLDQQEDAAAGQRRAGREQDEPVHNKDVFRQEDG